MRKEVLLNYFFVDWEKYVFIQLRVWEQLHRLWLNEFAGPIHIVFYETLVKNTSDVLHGILSFLNQTVSEVSFKIHYRNIATRKHYCQSIVFKNSTQIGIVAIKHVILP